MFSSAGGIDPHVSVHPVLRAPPRRHGDATESAAGPKALEHYLEAEEKGRLIQSLKAYLGDRRFDGTAVFSKRYSLEEMIALIVRHLLIDTRGLTPMTSRDQIRQGSDPVIPSRVVVGRPVHFSNAQNHEDDEFALGRLREAIAQCGFTEIVFEYEPVAAAYSYEQTLDRDELILIGDFGGGTSDFSVLRVGPTQRRRGRTREDIVGTDGVAVAGDAFDKQIIRKLVAPRLGLGSEYFSPPGKFLPIPSWPYERLERWHHLSFLNTAKNLEMLENLRRSAIIPGTPRGVRAPHQERNGIPAARGGAPDEVRAFRADRSAVRISLRAGVDYQRP